MSDVIIILILIVILGFAVKSSIKHFKGEGACCGGGSGQVKTKRPKKKKLDGPVIGTRTIKISGMHCQNCVKRVENAFHAREGFYVKADLAKGTALVRSKQEVPDEELKQMVRKLGYSPVSVEPLKK